MRKKFTLIKELFKKIRKIKYNSKFLIVIFGVIMIWRGIWNFLDYIDSYYLLEDHIITSIISTLIGISIIILSNYNLDDLF